ncbi:hypothetical protein F3Y22_tig00002847pilonHSYRG00107 [Hibiscus syriacus]|uniref:Uncharacterized protein n=1 Tax=Hibiscus syriacus TaxID=106335 RepID=A0A6A3CUH8_HIBSY|nr:hypothetical protein F3Y22_tig00002847pilonHSYRG00107 [Hibiscus syriacus]
MSKYSYWLKLALKMSHMDLSDLDLQNASNILILVYFQCLFDLNLMIPMRSNFDNALLWILMVLSDTEEILNSDSDEENKLLYWTKIGFSEAEASIAMERYQITQRTLPEDAIGSPYFYYEQIHLSNPMIGFGVHTKPDQITQRTLPEDAIGSFYFYYEHMALALVNKGSVRLLKLMTMSYLRVSRSMFMMSAENGIWYGLEGIKLLHLNLMRWKCFYISLKTIHEDLYRDMFHGGINVLSLFSGINDAEVAFYCLGILLKTDVQELNDDRLEQLMSSFVKFDLVVSGIQRNNLTGRNKHHCDGLEDFCWCIYLQ